MRRFLITAHLLIASFLAPAFVLVAVSGGLYLIGEKGSIESASIEVNGELDFSSSTLEQDLRSLLAANGVEQEFEYIKNRGSLLQTRPTSKTHLEISNKDGVLSVTRNVPSLQKSMIELHKGHGPLAFKTYQKAVAVCLLLVMLSGVWMGLINPGLRRKTLLATGLGLLCFFLLALA